MIYVLLLIGGLFSSPNDTTGLNFLKEYDTEYLSYHHLSVSLNEYGYLDSDSYNSASVYGDFRYYRRVYSRSKDFYFWVQPYQYFDFYEGYFSLSSRGYLIGTFQWYPLSFPIFTLIQGDLNGDYSKRQGTDILKSGVAEVEVGLGFGRIIPLYDAYKTLKVEEELINLGELSGKFDRRDLEKISEQIIRKEKYLDERDFWKDLDSIITETENFKNDRLNAVSAIRINRILGTSLRTKLSRISYLSGVDRGYETGLYLGYNYRYYSRIDEIGDEDYANKEKEIYAGVRYDVAHPISVKLNLYGHSSGEAYLSDSLGFKEINLKAGLNYEVFNSFFSDFSIEYSNNTRRYYTWDREDEERFSLIWRNLYYIDYKLSISVNGSFAYSLRRGDDHTNLFRGSLSSSLNYNFF
jgi:hypothetical protein